MHDVFDFINRLIVMFPSSFTQSNKDFWYDSYKEVLENPNIDFEKLFKIMILEHKEKSFAPAPEWLREKSKKCYKKNICQNEKYRDVWVLDPTLANSKHPQGVPNQFCIPANCSNDTLLNHLKQRFPSKEGWKILEGYC